MKPELDLTAPEAARIFDHEAVKRISAVAELLGKQYDKAHIYLVHDGATLHLTVTNQGRDKTWRIGTVGRLERKQL